MSDRPIAQRPPKLKQPLWAITFRTIKPDEVSQHREGHLAHQVKLERSGILFGAGPLADPDGKRSGKGLIIIRADSASEARQIADSDPMFKAGVREYELQQWQLGEGSVRITVNFSDGKHLVE
jgi:uncharacterized protein YciI